MKRRSFLGWAGVGLAFQSLPFSAQTNPIEAVDPSTGFDPNTADLDALAKAAYIYTYPMVKNYLTLYQYALEEGGAQYKAPLNHIANVARVYTPADTAIITPNSDTPYSFIVLDLRAEPIVVTMPPIEESRYYSLQIVDLYTHNIGYLGTREDGNGGGDFLITGPGWSGTPPEGIKRVVELPTWLGLGLMRTQLFNPEDLEAVKQIQALYTCVPLSTYTATEAPSAPPTEWPAISDALIETDYWKLVTFLLPFAPPIEGDAPLREALTKIGLSDTGASVDRSTDAEHDARLARAQTAGFEAIKTQSFQTTDSSDIFGTPEDMRGRYLVRAAAAYGGIYGNSLQEARYVPYMFSPDGVVLSGQSGPYLMVLKADELPPVSAFWSMTMYDKASLLLVENPIQRYLVNSAMLDSFVRDAEGNIPLYIQTESPGKELEANWLPAPAGEFYTVLRLYLPKPAAMDGRWSPPAITTAP